MRDLWQLVDKLGPDDCWPFLSWKTKDGYGRLRYKGRLWLAYRLAWTLTFGEIPRSNITAHGTVIRHTCDNPSCCNPAHLRMGSQLDNIKDRHTKNRNGDHKGEAHGKARLTNEDVFYIRASKESGSALSEKYGVCRQVIWAVRHKKSWSHI